MYIHLELKVSGLVLVLFILRCTLSEIQQFDSGVFEGYQICPKMSFFPNTNLSRLRFE